jgi:hypothetical protein
MVEISGDANGTGLVPSMNTPAGWTKDGEATDTNSGTANPVVFQVGQEKTTSDWTYTVSGTTNTAGLLVTVFANRTGSTAWSNLLDNARTIVTVGTSGAHPGWSGHRRQRDSVHQDRNRHGHDGRHFRRVRGPRGNSIRVPLARGERNLDRVGDPGRSPCRLPQHRHPPPRQRRRACQCPAAPQPACPPRVR